MYSKRWQCHQVHITFQKLAYNNLCMYSHAAKKYNFCDDLVINAKTTKIIHNENRDY